MSLLHLRCRRFTVSAILVGSLIACSEGAEPLSGAKIPSGVTRNVLLDAPGLVQQALTGVYRRGEQDDMLKREAELPGFGGFFIDSSDQVIVYMKPSAGTADSLVRTTLQKAYANREAYVRRAMAKAYEAQIRPGQYTLSELIAIENAISHSPIRIPGYVGVGASLILNHVVVGFEDSTSVAPGLKAIASLGVPEASLISQVWGKATGTATWQNTVRPVGSGLLITIANQTFRPDEDDDASLGYNVRTSAGVTYFMTVAHGPNGWNGVNGATGDTVWQPRRSFAPTPMGQIVINPPWGTSCGTNPNTGQPFDYCVDADVALGTYTGATSQRAIGTSDYEGLNGNSGTQHIHGWYAIQGVLAPEFIPARDTGEIHKSGWATGTTTGALTLPVMQLAATVKWGPTGTEKWIAYFNVAQVRHAGWGWGDSGGPVFVRNNGSGAPYYAVGIQAAGTGAYPGDVLVCSAGTACAFYFTPWSDMEEWLGMGTLNPATTQ